MANMFSLAMGLKLWPQIRNRFESLKKTQSKIETKGPVVIK